MRKDGFDEVFESSGKKIPRDILESQEELSEMSNIYSNTTNLPYTVWMLKKTGKEKHGPRIKVEVNHEKIPVSIDDHPQVMIPGKIRIPRFSVVQNWIIDNKALFLDYWYSRNGVDIATVVTKMKKAPKRGN